MTLLSVTEKIRNEYDDATRDWLAIDDPRRRRAMWHQRVIRDRELTVTAVRLAGLVLGSYEIGVGNPVGMSLRRTADVLGVTKMSLIRARDLLVERGWLVRVNDGLCKARYNLGPGPRVTAVIPPMVTALRPQSNKSLTSLSESKRSQSRGPISDREDSKSAPPKIDDWLIDDSGDDCPF